jgi:hypothetical protein
MTRSIVRGQPADNFKQPLKTAKVTCCAAIAMQIVGDYHRTGTVRWQDSLSVRHESIASDERSTRR